MIHKVGTDGWISFGHALNNSNPALFPTNSADEFWTFTVAPFWSNLDTSQGGNVSWEIHNISLSHELIETVNNFIHDEYGDVNFNGTWMLLGFWEDVTPSGKSSPVSFFYILNQLVIYYNMQVSNKNNRTMYSDIQNKINIIITNNPRTQGNTPT